MLRQDRACENRVLAFRDGAGKASTDRATLNASEENGGELQGVFAPLTRRTIMECMRHRATSLWQVRRFAPGAKQLPGCDEV